MTAWMLRCWGETPAAGQSAEVLYLQKVAIQDGQSVIKITVDKKPVSAGIDPFNKMIDRLPDDNIKQVLPLTQAALTL